MVCCVFSLELPRQGDSNENTQYTFMLMKIKKISILSLLTRRYNQPSLARTTPVRTNFHGPKGVRAIEVRLYLWSKCMYWNTAYSVLFLYQLWTLASLNLKVHLPCQKLFYKTVNCIAISAGLLRLLLAQPDCLSMSRLI